MPTRNVDLTEHFDTLIPAGIESGQYSDASEVVREGLRLLEQRQREDAVKLEWMRGAAQEGIDSINRGDYTIVRSRAEISSYIRSAGSARQ